ncbi:hypothetical protein MnTg02_00512 [bacterium MnTg02]|nr:hypothetical protein MnTg02_00512 [bacterium MnTg02]
MACAAKAAPQNTITNAAPLPAFEPAVKRDFAAPSVQPIPSSGPPECHRIPQSRIRRIEIAARVALARES